MITRIVKMTFKAEEITKFIEIFGMTKDMIVSFEGCYEVKLMRDNENENVFFTLSKWESDQHLNSYRSSDLFKTTWGNVKSLFSENAEAWSLVDMINK
jgi:heme-degrading monooxygenase HmoA